MAALVMAQAAVAAVQAATAADLAALAGADVLRGLQDPGPGNPGAGGTVPDTGQACEVAGDVAARNNASVASCTPDARTATVTVETRVRVPALPVFAAARARAGPPG